MKNSETNNIQSHSGNTLPLSAVLIKKKKIEEVLRKYVIELDEISG